MKYCLFFLLFPFALSAQVEEALEDTLPSTEMVADTAYLEEEELEEAYSGRAPYIAPPLKPLALREVRPDQWDKASDGMDYSKDVPKPPREPKTKAPNTGESGYDWTGATKGLGTLLQLLAVLFALSMIAYGIYWMMQTPRNRVLSRDGTEIPLANLDEYIHETDLERFLREALAASNWSLAVRLYFLQTIKQLSEKGVIVWSKEKTNRDYMREMRSHRLGNPFRDATRQYERVWYGNQGISAADFAKLEPEFKALLGEI